MRNSFCFMVIIITAIGFSCAKKEKAQPQYNKNRFDGTWNSTKHSSATGTGTYTVHFSSWPHDLGLSVYPFSDIHPSGGGVASLDYLAVERDDVFFFSHLQINHGEGYATGYGRLINNNTAVMQYTINHTSATNTSQEICTENMTR